MSVCVGSILVVGRPSSHLDRDMRLTLWRLVVPTNMNPMSGGGDIFKGLIDKVPAKRVGRLEDVAGTVIYLSSKAGVSLVQALDWLLYID